VYAYGILPLFFAFYMPSLLAFIGQSSTGASLFVSLVVCLAVVVVVIFVPWWLSFRRARASYLLSVSPTGFQSHKLSDIATVRQEVESELAHRLGSSPRE
jgi:hypothetical protein